MRTIRKIETVCYRPFINENFERVCIEKVADRQYRENGMRDKHSNYSQRKASRECFPNESKDYIPSKISSSNGRDLEDSGKILACLVFEFSIFRPKKKKFAFIARVQVDSCSQNFVHLGA